MVNEINSYRQVVAAAEQWVKRQLERDSSGHDWWHIERVRAMAVRLARATGAEEQICELAALLHDIPDEKLTGDEAEGLKQVRIWLEQHDVPEEHVLRIMHIISAMSFKGGGRPPMETLEDQVVQDADRLDAIGAIGIARTFAYSGWKGQAIHDPELPARESMTHEQYRSGKSTAVNHFYEKLLKLSSLMNTPEAKRIAEERHRFMEEFLRRFHSEWSANG